jgi:hypothetical protein
VPAADIDAEYHHKQEAAASYRTGVAARRRVSWVDPAPKHVTAPLA